MKNTHTLQSWALQWRFCVRLWIGRFMIFFTAKFFPFSCKKLSCKIKMVNYFRFITKVVQNSVEKVTLSDFKASQRAPRKDFCLVLWFNFSHFSKTANSTTLFVLGILWKIWLASPIESLAWQKIAKKFFWFFCNFAC